MKDTIYNKKQVQAIVDYLNEKREKEDLNDFNYLECLKVHPDQEICAIANNYKLSEWDFLDDLMASPDFEHLMEEG